jgi:hypothetical protein
MKKFTFFAIMIAALTLGFQFSSTAQTLLEENFDYPANDLITAHGWTAHNAGGVQPITVVAPGLTFPGYIASGIGNAALADNTGEDDHKTFATQTTGTIYSSMMVKVTTTSLGYFFHFGLNPNTTSFRGKLFMDATNHFGISFTNNTGTYATSTFTPGTTYILVTKYEIVPGTNNDKVSLFVFNGTIPLSEPAATVGPITEPTQLDINPGSVGIRQYSATQNVTVDGIRVATTWSALLPAPPAPIPTASEWGLIFMFVALLSIGAIYIMRRRNSELSV